MLYGIYGVCEMLYEMLYGVCEMLYGTIYETIF
jgi:hypothetical protein